MSNAVYDQAQGRLWAAYHADCVALMETMPAASIDMSVYSPPFSSLYIYSDSIADMGNCADDKEFIEQYRFAVREKFRITRPGRLSAVHVKDLVYYQNSSPRGTSGLRPFSDMCTALHLEEGWDLHSRITIWRDPVKEMQKTKAHGLLYKTLRADSTFSRVGMPEYLLIFRKWAKEGEDVVPVTHTREEFPLAQWQDYASPVWMKMRETDVLNVAVARGDKDEKHLCPMPLDITKRAVRLFSNPNDVVMSPFMGIGSEGVAALSLGRRFIGAELKHAYWRLAVKHLTNAEHDGMAVDMFAGIAAE